MPTTIENLTARMDEAARQMDFETASRLRDQIVLMRGGATAEDAADAATAALTRQKSGAMGLGTSQVRMTPPEGWQKPQKPDPMTSGRSRRPR
jgi:hypothetical protein